MLKMMMMVVVEVVVVHELLSLTMVVASID